MNSTRLVFDVVILSVIVSGLMRTPELKILFGLGLTVAVMNLLITVNGMMSR